MTAQSQATSVQHEVVVDVPIERAFSVFTEDFGRFKPREHNMLSVEIAETPARTRVELEHRKLNRHLDGWESLREGVNGDAGWPLYLQRYAELFAA